jgi:hypothetical protein
MSETPLQMTERHVREGEQRIANQKALIARLKHVGHAVPIDAAVDFLGQMEDFQRLSVEHLDRERAKLTDSIKDTTIGRLNLIPDLPKSNLILQK